MTKKPFATISFIFLSLAGMVMAPIFDSSVYGVNGHPNEWLSFVPNAPFRNMGLSLFCSPFLHINFVHVLSNMIFFIPVAMMMERQKSGYYLTMNFLLIHFQVLSLLIIINFLSPFGDKAFLGSSHVIVGLYTFWSLSNKKFGMLFWPLLIIGVGLWEANYLTLLAHALGLLVGIGLLFFSRLYAKLNPQRPN